MSDEKEIRWVGSAYDDLLAFPDDPRRHAGFQLGKVQAGTGARMTGSRSTTSAPGTREIRIRDSERQPTG